VHNSSTELEEARRIALTNRTEAQTLEGQSKNLFQSASQKVAELNRRIDEAAVEQEKRMIYLSGQVQQFDRPLPPPSGQPPFRLSLERVVGDKNLQGIKKSGKLVFHVAGNTGGGTRPHAQLLVAEAVTRQCEVGDVADRPAFLYLLG